MSLTPWLPAELQPLLAVAGAVIGSDGTLREANAGFLRLINAPHASPTGMPVARFLIQPDFASLLHAPSVANGDIPGEIHRGLLTIGEHPGGVRTLRGRVWRVAGQLRLLAEFDIEELEQLYDTVLELNREYSESQLQLAQTNLKLQQREVQIVAASLTDTLTGIGNRRRLDQELAAEIGRATRSGRKLCMFMADFDHFKRVNDGYGHEAGDKVLAAFGDLLRQEMRATDIVARFGGEEFIALLPDTDLTRALEIAERIRTTLEACRIAPLVHAVTASFGVVEWAAGESGDGLLQRADTALYRAKRLGRNRVIAG